MIYSAIASTSGHHGGNQTWTTVVLVSVLLLWPALSVWFFWRNNGPDDSGEGGGPGGPLPDPDGPGWWPDFERQFAAHVADLRGSGAFPSSTPD